MVSATGANAVAPWEVSCLARLWYLFLEIKL